MIICDKHKFVFIHIPKCAGTSVRQVLQKFDSTGGKFSPSGQNPRIPRLDMVHLPLPVLRQRFPQEYQKIDSYFSVAVLRNPFSRFPSSLYQRLSMYGEKNIKGLSRQEFKAALDESITFLSKQPQNACLPYDYIHFQTQVSYVFDQGVRRVQRLYTPQNLLTMFHDLSALVLEDLGAGKKPTHLNKSVVYKSDLKRFTASLISPLYTKTVQNIIPLNIKLYFRSKFYKDIQSQFGDLFTTQFVMDFVSSYYSKDIELYEELAIDISAPPKKALYP